VYFVRACLRACVCIHRERGRDRGSLSSSNGEVWWRDLLHTMMNHRVGTDIAKVDVQTRIPAERSGLQIMAAGFFSPPKRPDQL